MYLLTARQNHVIPFRVPRFRVALITRSREEPILKLTHLIGASAIAATAMAGSAMASTTVCLITKTDTNPFFVKMKGRRDRKG